MKNDNSVLVVGSGGREHALVWKLSQSRRVKKLYCAPGNAGTAALAENVPISATNVVELADYCVAEGIDLVVIGPEASLDAGLADRLSERGVRVFGPSRLAARLESSKAFSKAFMLRHQIPTANAHTFTDFKAASEYWRQNGDRPLVIKASGLAAGKGVFLPDDHDEGVGILRTLLVENCMGSAGCEILIEDRLFGDELSVMAFSDGKSYKLMPAAQDHKRLLDKDKGPNTGGMGAYAPAPLATQDLLDEIAKTVIQPAIAGMRAEGHPFNGILYAGMILTHSGPRVLEFNARFGDPETQAVLPLLKTDLFEVLDACVEGRLADRKIDWHHKACTCVVLAAKGYPGKAETGVHIDLPAKLDPATHVFHAGTAEKAGQLVTSGGRVLGVCSTGQTLSDATAGAYHASARITFEGKQFRTDIARQALDFPQQQAYRNAGVDIDAGNQAVELIKKAVGRTVNGRVLSSIGSFGGLYDAAWLKEFDHPVLVASTDGVGTKVKLAAHYKRYSGIGEDIVNHCIDDILVQGAKPLFFLDYFATSKLDPMVIATIVEGIAKASSESGCVLLGGETAEMPGVYLASEFDVAGTIVGVVEKAKLLPRADIHAGDVLLGFSSSGLHTNGFSLVRSLFQTHDLAHERLQTGETLLDALLAPHRSYLNLLMPLIELPSRPIKALAHITGGGFIENIPRVLPDGLGASLNSAAWPIPEIYKLMQKIGKVSQGEMMRVFNMGIGMVAVCAPESVNEITKRVSEPVYQIGRVIPAEGKEVLIR